MFKTYVVWGSDGTVADLATQADDLSDLVHEYAFNTQAELDAFLLGVNEADGWTDSTVFDSVKEGVEHIQEILGSPQV